MFWPSILIEQFFQRNLGLLKKNSAIPNHSFFASLNEGGTLRTLNGIIAHSPGTQPMTSAMMTSATSEDTTPFSESLFTRRMPADEFCLTPAGGVFRCSTDPKISVRFPPNAVASNASVVMQVRMSLRRKENGVSRRS